MTLIVFLGCCSLQIVAAVKQKNGFRKILEVSSLGNQQMASGKELRASFAHRLNRSADDSHVLSEKEEVSSTITAPAGEGADKDVFMAKLAREAERYDDMAVHVQAAVSKHPDGLSKELRELLSAAYRPAIDSLRGAWETISEVEEKQKGTPNAEHAKEYRRLIETEIRKECQAKIQWLDGAFISTAKGDFISTAKGDDKLYYLKTKGDYWRYIAQYPVDDPEIAREAKDEAKKAYQEGKDFAEKNADNVKKTNVYLLGLLLNFSVFYYEILGEVEEACKMARQAFEDSIADLDELDDDDYKPATLIMQLLRDNLTLWTS